MKTEVEPKVVETEVYILMADCDGTMRSRDVPIGVAVTSKEEAERFVKEGGIGYTHAYEKVRIFTDKDAALAALYGPKKSS